MNILKNFEALFIATLGLACAADYVIESGTPQASAPAIVQASKANAMPVITVSARRLTAAEKMQSLAAEKAALTTSATNKI